MRIVAVDPTSCVACRNCEYACAFKQTGDFDVKHSNIRVNFYPEERVCIPWTCLHCGEGWCMEIDANRCAGCKMCLLACPFGSIHFDKVELVSKKCDLCGGDPNCVKFCTSGALQFVEEDEAYSFRRESLDAKLKALFGLNKRGG